MAKIKTPRSRVQPKPAFKKFFALREVRVSSTSGHVAVIRPNKPIELPRQLWQDAYKSGAMEYDPELIRAAARAVEAADAKEEVTFDGALQRAVRQLVAAAKPGELSKTTGAPKVGPVKRVMLELGVSEKELKGLTTDVIYDTFSALASEAASEADDEDDGEELDTADLADEDGILEPVGKGVAGLLGEAEEADSDEE